MLHVCAHHEPIYRAVVRLPTTAAHKLAQARLGIRDQCKGAGFVDLTALNVVRFGSATGSVRRRWVSSSIPS
jgi:hypothetical protein